MTQATTKKGPPCNPFLKSRQVVVRLTEQDKTALTQYCETKDVTESMAVRTLIRNTLKRAFPSLYQPS